MAVSDQAMGHCQVDQFTASGTYDGEPKYALLAARFGPQITVTISPPRVPMRPKIRRHGTIISLKLQATGGWPGRKPQVTINAAEVKLLWGAGRPLSVPS